MKIEKTNEITLQVTNENDLINLRPGDQKTREKLVSFSTSAE